MAEQTARLRVWFKVPAGTPSGRCRSCNRVVYWIFTSDSKRMPVDCDVPGGEAPWKGVPGDGERDGRGESHFATCPQANHWRKS